MTTGSSTSSAETAREAAGAFRATFQRVREQVGRVLVGQDDVVEGVLGALMAGGHVLLEGVPGLGKTLLVRSLGEALDLRFSRIQFTPDMMPADVQGTNVLVEGEHGGHTLEFREGPLVANLVLADEINRATPKTQSALLEAMQERQITVGRKTMPLDEPYCVMATQNPVEQEGTYPLPEAQLDRFLMKLLVGYPEALEYAEILARTTGAATPTIDKVADASDVLAMRTVVRQVPVPDHVTQHAVNLVLATQPDRDGAPSSVREHVQLGASPRGAQGLILGGKVKALLDGRFAVSTDDIRAVALPVLRHRVLLGYRALSERVTPDQIVASVLEHVPA